MKSILIKLAQKFKSIKILGRQRFWFLYWAYRITGWHIRHKEWDFVLKYLPALHNDNQKVKVLDIGCRKTLFGFELLKRGYDYWGVDIGIGEIYLPELYQHWDITKDDGLDKNSYDFVICISVLEHIGNEGRGDLQKQTDALGNMIKSLKVGGRLLLTCPTEEFAQGHIWHGFSWTTLVSMLDLIPVKCRAVESTERLGQLCVAIERCT